MALLLIRAILVYFLTLVAMKAMGKRQLGQLQPFELVIVLIISEMASLAMQSNNVSLINSVALIVTITLLQILLSYFNLKSEKLRILLCGRPAILINRGKLSQKEMTRQRINLDDLQELCRNQGYFDLSGINMAIMETNGQLSIMPRTDKRPVQAGDILEKLPIESMSELVVQDGHLDRRALKFLGLEERWLLSELEKLRAGEIHNLFIVGLDEEGQLFWQAKEKKS